MRQRKHPANPRFTISCESSKVLVVANRTLHLGVSALAAPQPCDGLTRHVRALVLLMGRAKVERKLALYPCSSGFILENEKISSIKVCLLQKIPLEIKDCTSTVETKLSKPSPNRMVWPFFRNNENTSSRD
uniref:(northern house mosquito) hypothetical protein n=1 Tax=Culex pipiens TaxID=7175 RepID=A0A8D8ACQ3_CULPI